MGVSDGRLAAENLASKVPEVGVVVIQPFVGTVRIRLPSFLSRGCA